ncbi:hypothetical protein C4K68_26485 [Pokkaliibacter plantistimulans]|uniref:Iron dicitrate transport regulator FecR n=2 Tax=Pseudomonadota TaxID=1224 RepID=A0A2S5KHL0_9PROT|nr:hypothetical protein C4K68_26485 [Pokkaliibacter plantistimulans]
MKGASGMGDSSPLQGEQPTALEQAIDWMVQMQSGEVGADERHAWQRWLEASTSHLQAWEQVSQALGRTVVPLRQHHIPAQLPQQAMADTDVRGLSRRRLLGGSLMLAGLAAGSSWLLHQQQWLADLRTGVAERRRFSLPDGSKVLLDACSAVDVQFDQQRRGLFLRRGALQIQSVDDAARPLQVSTAEGQVQVLGRQLMVRQGEGQTLVLAQDQGAMVANQAGQVQWLKQGQGLWFAADRLGAPQRDLLDLAAWQHGMLVVRDRPLAEVVAALRPYRHGLLRVAPEVAGLRVLGAFPLDDSNRLLTSLAQTLPIRVRYYSDLLVMIEAA